MARSSMPAGTYFKIIWGIYNSFFTNNPSKSPKAAGFVEHGEKGILNSEIVADIFFHIVNTFSNNGESVDIPYDILENISSSKYNHSSDFGNNPSSNIIKRATILALGLKNDNVTPLKKTKLVEETAFTKFLNDLPFFYHCLVLLWHSGKPINISLSLQVSNLYCV